MEDYYNFSYDFIEEDDLDSDAVYVATIRGSGDIFGYWWQKPSPDEIMARVAKSLKKSVAQIIEYEWFFDVKMLYPMTNSSQIYDPDFGDDKLCECGHSYGRHFDPYERMELVGCKYCQCFEFKSQI